MLLQESRSKINRVRARSSFSWSVPYTSTQPRWYDRGILSMFKLRDADSSTRPKRLLLQRFLHPTRPPHHLTANSSIPKVLNRRLVQRIDYRTWIRITLNPSQGGHSQRSRRWERNLLRKKSTICSILEHSEILTISLYSVTLYNERRSKLVPVTRSPFIEMPAGPPEPEVEVVSKRHEIYSIQNWPLVQEYADDEFKVYVSEIPWSDLVRVWAFII